MAPTVDDYGWEDGSPPCSCDYLTPVIVEMTKSLGARSILDLGCGNGALCRELANQGLEVAGLEPDAKGLELCRRSIPKGTFYHMDLGGDPEAILQDHPEGFDLIISTEVVEHLFAPRQLPNFAAKVLGKDGRLLITTPYHGYLKNLALSVLNKWDKHHTPLWDGGHIKFWSPSTLDSLMAERAFVREGFRGVGRLPLLWKSMLLVYRLGIHSESRVA